MEYQLVKEIRDINCIINKEITKYSNPYKYINPTQIQIMLYLLRHMDEEICQKDIEAETHLKKASVTGTLDSLEEKGAIKRIQDETDKRKNLIVLTKRALEYKDKLINKTLEVEENALKGISEKELKQFFSTIEKIKGNLEAK